MSRGRLLHPRKPARQPSPIAPEGRMRRREPASRYRRRLHLHLLRLRAAPKSWSFEKSPLLRTRASADTSPDLRFAERPDDAAADLQVIGVDRRDGRFVGAAVF